MGHGHVTPNPDGFKAFCGGPLTCIDCALELTTEQYEGWLVRALGERIGFGQLMQLAERIWNKIAPGGAHSVGPCVALLVPCPHPDRTDDDACAWCCGTGRVTRRVREAMEARP